MALAGVFASRAASRRRMAEYDGCSWEDDPLPAIAPEAAPRSWLQKDTTATILSHDLIRKDIGCLNSALPLNPNDTPSFLKLAQNEVHTLDLVLLRRSGSC